MADSQPPTQAEKPSAQADAPIKEEELDTQVDAELQNSNSTAADTSMTGDNQTSAEDSMEQRTNANGLPDTAPEPEAPIPVKKDATLREFLGKMDEYAPIIPDAVTNYYLTLAGLPPPPQTPLHLARLLALATQKFVADIAADAYQYSRIRSSNTTSNNPMGGLSGAAGAPPGAAGAAGAQAGKEGAGQGKASNLGVQRPGYGGGGQGGSQGRTVLTMEDLGMAVGEYGVNVKRGEFYR